MTVLPNSAGFADVALEVGLALAGRADRGQVGRAEQAAARAEVGVALEAAGDGEELGALGQPRRCPSKPWRSAQIGTSSSVSEASASFAVAPL